MTTKERPKSSRGHYDGRYSPSHSSSSVDSERDACLNSSFRVVNEKQPTHEQDSDIDSNPRPRPPSTKKTKRTNDDESALQPTLRRRQFMEYQNQSSKIDQSQ
jgi:hypothetical protein